MDWNIGREVALFMHEGSNCVVFRNGFYRRIPEGCRVRLLMGLRGWGILASSEGVGYPEHLYGSLAVKRTVDGIAILDSKNGSVLRLIKSAYEGEVLFNRDKSCIETYRLTP